MAALALGRVVAGLLYGVTPTDPVTLLTVALFLAAVAMLATYLPARQAAKPPTVARTDASAGLWSGWAFPRLS